jgi:hypothetical protein
MRWFWQEMAHESYASEELPMPMLCKIWSLSNREIKESAILFVLEPLALNLARYDDFVKRQAWLWKVRLWSIT